MLRITPSRSVRLVATSVAAVAAGVVLLSGCSLPVPGQAPVRDESGAITESNDRTDVFALRVGDCLLDAGSATEVTDTPTVPCGEPHDYEVFHSADLSGDEFPGAEAVGAEADQICYDAFTPFVGTAYEESVLEFDYYLPTEGSWEAGDREILCLVYDTQAQVTGGLAGVAR